MQVAFEARANLSKAPSTGITGEACQIRMIIEFQLGADFLSWPTWFSHYEIDLEYKYVGDFDPAELPISQNTRDRLKKWKAVYDDLYQEDYSVRPMSEEERIWSREMLRLWVQISKEISAAQENSSNPDIYRAYHEFMYQGEGRGFTLDTLPDELREKYREDIDHSSESLL